MKKVQELANEIRDYWNNKDTDSELAIKRGLFSILDKHSPIEKPFPKFMKYGDNGPVVLFTSMNEGRIIIKNDSPQDVGWHSSMWSGKGFKDCEITVK